MSEVGLRWAIAAAAFAFLVVAVVGGAAAQAPRGPSTIVLAIAQSPTIVTEQSALSVSVEVASSTNIQSVYFTFCQLDPPYVCYLPIAMVAQGANWFQGATQPMTSYQGMSVGAKAGYNITIAFKDHTNLSEPTVPNPFANLSLARTIAGEYVFEMTVSDQVYGLSGRVYDAATVVGVPGATVALAPGNRAPVATDATGAYSFANLFNGTYTVSVTGGGYRASSASVAIAGHSAVKDIPMSSGATPPGHGGNGAKGGFFGTAAGLSTLVVVPVAAVAVALVALWMSRRSRVAPHPPVDGPQGTPQPAWRKPD